MPRPSNLVMMFVEKNVIAHASKNRAAPSTMPTEAMAFGRVRMPAGCATFRYWDDKTEIAFRANVCGHLARLGGTCSDGRGDDVDDAAIQGRGARSDAVLLQMLSAVDEHTHTVVGKCPPAGPAQLLALAHVDRRPTAENPRAAPRHRPFDGGRPCLPLPRCTLR